jgi:transcriptional antiterminator RfaH
MDWSGEFWYCVACQTRAEEAVAKQLASKSDVMVFLARMRVSVRKGGVTRTALAPMFPGYVFVRMRLTGSLIAVRYTPGVRDLVRFGSRIPIVPDEVIRELREAVRESAALTRRASVEAGMAACVQEGPFEGFTGTVLQFDCAKERIRLLIELLGHSRVLDVPLTAVGPLVDR